MSAEDTMSTEDDMSAEDNMSIEDDMTEDNTIFMSWDYNMGTGGNMSAEEPEDTSSMDDGDADDDADLNPSWTRRARRSSFNPDRFPTVPSEEGAELMNSGLFGDNEYQALKPGGVLGKVSLARRILDRELATESYVKQKINMRLMAQGMMPSSKADVVINFDDPVYSGQFSDDGNFFYSVNKDFQVHLYNTSSIYNWRHYKTVNYPSGRWTLTDASLSPDNKFLAYTSLRSKVCLAVTDPNDTGDAYSLDLANNGGRTRLIDRYFGIYSIRFSGDGRNLVAGTSGGSIIVYDIQSNRSIHRIKGHKDDVNAVCFADKSSPHILYSGSDDTLLKVWDTRSIGDNRAAGVFVGHIEGITYIDSKNDGRYILSNGKDQNMKLWDLRMVMPSEKYQEIHTKRRVYNNTNPFDYTSGTYNENKWYRDKYDNSVVTYRGHKVLRTLIRCHFSPPGSTNSRYVYTGSHDGKVYIYNMDASLAATIDVKDATKIVEHFEFESLVDIRARADRVPEGKACVRDAAWHPHAPMIVASSSNGRGIEYGTCSIHSWNDGAGDDEGIPKMGLKVNSKMESNEGNCLRSFNL